MERHHGRKSIRRRRPPGGLRVFGIASVHTSLGDATTVLRSGAPTLTNAMRRRSIDRDSMHPMHFRRIDSQPPQFTQRSAHSFGAIVSQCRQVVSHCGRNVLQRVRIDRAHVPNAWQLGGIDREHRQVISPHFLNDREFEPIALQHRPVVLQLEQNDREQLPYASQHGGVVRQFEPSDLQHFRRISALIRQVPSFASRSCTAHGMVAQQRVPDSWDSAYGPSFTAD